MYNVLELDAEKSRRPSDSKDWQEDGSSSDAGPMREEVHLYQHHFEETGGEGGGSMISRELMEKGINWL